MQRREPAPSSADRRGTATSRRVHTALPVDDAWTALERELETLADILPFLLAHDDERPIAWSAPAFVGQVEFVRSSVATVAKRRHLAARLGPARVRDETGRFERAAQRVAVDPVAVGLTIRWLEIETDSRLPSWTDILRRRTLDPTPPGLTSADTSLGFG